MRDSMQKKNKNKPYFSRQQYKAPVVYSWGSAYFILVIKFVVNARKLFTRFCRPIAMGFQPYTAMKILGIAYPKHWILLVVSKYLDEHLMQINLLVLSN